ncbi:MAG TPA: HlyD family efflux transporter periplasmic adaptor subunit [Candidatus Sulfotelmatobacter sp.]|nr:HlyD family efflux transporter periplasmic adaptor subunit [Candidatus Sulfotelmatobacter sp.]
MELSSTDAASNPDPSRPRPAAPPGAPRTAPVDAGLWRQFSEVATPERFYRHWLALQCRMLRGVSTAVLVLGPPGEGPYAPAAVWPESAKVEKPLAEAAERALAEKRGIVLPHAPESPDGAPAGERHLLAYPIYVSGRLHGVVAAEIEGRPEADLQAATRQLQWGAAWIEALWLREEAARAAAIRARLQSVLDVLATTLGRLRFQEATTAFVTALATELRCERVSLGFVRRQSVRVRAVSHSAEVRSHMNLMRDIAAAMDEAVEQNSTLVYPSPEGAPPRVLGAHAELIRAHGSGSVCSVPLCADGRLVGALTLERSADQAFEQSAVDLCEAVAALAGPILELQRREDRWLVTKVGAAFRDLVGRLLGPQHLALKFSLLALAAAGIFLATATGTHRVSATATLEPVVRRAVVAPFAGYVAEAPSRAGDLVREGQILAALDERELRLQWQKWASQYEQVARQHQQALAQHNAAQAVILAAQMDQARAEMALLEDQLKKSRIPAPIAGIVVTGDLSQSLRAPVERGQVLFEVAPLDAFRVVLQVDETAIAYVRSGQAGRLILSGAPHVSLPFQVAKVTPVSTAKDGRNYFRVEATLAEAPPRMRPGMEGVGKIEIGRRHLVWIWTHEVTEWVRLKLWTWLP